MAPLQNLVASTTSGEERFLEMFHGFLFGEHVKLKIQAASESLGSRTLATRATQREKCCPRRYT